MFHKNLFNAITVLIFAIAEGNFSRTMDLMKYLEQSQRKVVENKSPCSCSLYHIKLHICSDFKQEHKTYVRPKEGYHPLDAFYMEYNIYVMMKTKRV